MPFPGFTRITQRANNTQSTVSFATPKINITTPTLESSKSSDDRILHRIENAVIAMAIAMNKPKVAKLTLTMFSLLWNYL